MEVRINSGNANSEMLFKPTVFSERKPVGNASKRYSSRITLLMSLLAGPHACS
jgi:hypothetical protein